MGSLSPAWSFGSESADQTQYLAAEIAKGLQDGAVIGLEGDLGAGKTCFVQGLAAALGVRELRDVLSPTYAIAHEYPYASGVLTHVDFYRIDDPHELLVLGVSGQFGAAGTITVIEWADKFPDLLPGATIWLRWQWLSENRRMIEIEGCDRPMSLKDSVA